MQHGAEGEKRWRTLVAEQDFECRLLAAQGSLWNMETRDENMKTLISNLLKQITETSPRSQEVSGNIPTT